MSLAKKVAFNTGFDVFGRVIQLVIASISIIILTRYLGTQGYGFYALILAFVGMFSDISGLGINLTIARQIPKNPRKIESIFANALGLKILTSLIIFGLAILVGILIYPEPKLQLGIVLAGLSSFFLTIQGVYKPIYQIKLKLKNFVIADIVSRTIGFILLLIFVYLGLGLNYLIATLAISSLINLFLTDYFARKLIRVKLKISLKGWRTLIGQAFFVALVVILSGISQKIATVILSKLSGAEAVGFFELALRPILIIHGIGLLTIGLIYPIFARLERKNREKLYQLLEEINRYFQNAGIIITIFLFFFSSQIINILGGENFSSSGIILKIISFVLLTRFISLTYQNILIVEKKEKQVLRAFLAGLIVIVSLSFILIPSLGSLGAAWAFLVGEIVISLIILILGKKYLIKSKFFTSLAKDLPYYLILTAFYWLIYNYFFPLISFENLNILIHILILAILSLLAFIPLIGKVKRRI
jgi:O-antigen/teichoic acid export membrane protein